MHDIRNREDRMDNANFTLYEFELIKKNKMVYVDKTDFIYRIVQNEGMVVVNTAPRRLGKSLTVSTLKSLFSGNRELFRGLWIDHSDFPFGKHPVIRIDFGSLSSFTAEDTEAHISFWIQYAAAEAKIELDDGKPGIMLQNLLLKLKERYSAKPVILIDEYDRPMNECENPAERLRIQKALREFYSSLKGLVPYVHLTYITGVLHFSGLGIFSGLNNLVDISMDDNFSGLLGYTEDEIRKYFALGIREYAKKMKITEDNVIEQLRDWYDGYLLTPNGVRVYNPVSIGAFMYYLEFRNYWLRTGSSKIIVNYAKKYHINLRDLGDMAIELDDTAVFSILEFLDGEKLPKEKLLSLLYMTGYLTIDHNEDETLYLRFPNREVMRTLFLDWGNAYSKQGEQIEFRAPSAKIAKALASGDVKKAVEYINGVLALLAYDHFSADELTYCGFLMSILGASLEDISRGEEHTARGRLDIFASSGNHAYVIEVKLNRSADEAISQIEENGNTEKFLQWAGTKKRTLHEVGFSINSNTHKIEDWKETVL